MNIVALVCKTAFWGPALEVKCTDGALQGADLVWSVAVFLMPILNTAVMRPASSPRQALRLAALSCNVPSFVLACWLTADRYPSHPGEERLIEYVALMTLTPLVSAVAPPLEYANDQSVSLEVTGPGSFDG